MSSLESISRNIIHLMHRQEKGAKMQLFRGGVWFQLDTNQVLYQELSKLGIATYRPGKKRTGTLKLDLGLSRNAYRNLIVMEKEYSTQLVLSILNKIVAEQSYVLCDNFGFFWVQKKGCIAQDLREATEYSLKKAKHLVGKMHNRRLKCHQKKDFVKTSSGWKLKKITAGSQNKVYGRNKESQNQG